MFANRSPLRGATRTYRLGLGLAMLGLVLTAGVLVAVLAVLSVRPAPAHEIGVLGDQLAVPAANAQAIALLLLATLGSPSSSPVCAVRSSSSRRSDVSAARCRSFTA